MASLEAKLRAGVERLGLTLSGQQIEQLLAYQSLIEKWNKVYNLTALRLPDEMLTHHLLDSLAVGAPLRHQLALLQPCADHPASSPGVVRLLDVGSGAGLPGVVVAIACPQIRVDCVDTVAKKAAFVQQAAVMLKLANLRGLHARVESLTEKYQVVSCRAFASLADFTRWSAVAIAEPGIWMAMKARQPLEEIAALPRAVTVFHVEQVAVPGLDAERCIVWLRTASVGRIGAA